ncbi:uncharacterized protein [Arachis hypogaea]|uniref:uncharacterized protein n=1 Tax=Arachis hypogaea TaxID=3818 RepID=UPI003B223288
MDLYVETTDLRHHLNNFKSRMYLANTFDTTRCKAFPTTLTKAAMKWFDNLPPRSLTCFDDLVKKFLTRFSIQNDKVKHALSLLGFKQEVGETLRDYMERFNKTFLEIQNLPTEAVIMRLINGLKEGPFSQSISKRHPTFLYENVIEKQARKDLLERYLAERLDDQRKRKRDEDGGRQEHLPHTPERHIHMINGGFDKGGISNFSRKRHLKEVYQVRKDNKIPDLPTISFIKENAQGVTLVHDDSVVITMIIVNANLHRTLVDQGSSVDILFKPTFDKLGLEEKDMKKRIYLFGLGDTPI